MRVSCTMMSVDRYRDVESMRYIMTTIKSLC
jgi:hypothetical protein